MLDLALRDQVLDRARDIFDRHAGVDTVLVEEVDGLDPKPLQRAFGALLDLLGPTIRYLLTAGIDFETELGGYHDLLADRRQALSDQLFVGEGAVDLGRVEERDTPVDGPAEQSDQVSPVSGRTVGLAHAHAAETDGRDFEAIGLRTCGSQLSLLHADYSFNLAARSARHEFERRGAACGLAMWVASAKPGHSAGFRGSREIQARRRPRARRPRTPCSC